MYTQADLTAHLSKFYTPEYFAAEIARADTPFQLAVMESGQLAGFCKLALACGWPEHARGNKTVELKQLYTDPAMTGLGLGKTLMDWALDTARANGADEMQLSVWSGNDGAQRFYARYGFEKRADISYWVGEHRDDEFLFAAML